MAGVLAQSKISTTFENNALNLPESEVLPGTNLDIAYFLVGDEELASAFVSRKASTTTGSNL